MSFHNSINTYDFDVYARHIYKDGKDYEPFKNPLIHKRIDGFVIVPLNLEKLWGK